MTFLNPRDYQDVHFLNVDQEEERTLSILIAVESMPKLTQRMLACKMKVALGTANRLLRSLMAREWIEVSGENRGARYHLTPGGASEKLRLLNVHLHRNVTNYAQLRDRISESFDGLRGGRKRLVFYGAGDLAQVAYIALRKSDCKLVGIVDEETQGRRFFGHTIAHPSSLQDGKFNGRQFDTVVVADSQRAPEIVRNLHRLKIDPSRVLCVLRY